MANRFHSYFPVYSKSINWFTSDRWNGGLMKWFSTSLKWSNSWASNQWINLFTRNKSHFQRFILGITNRNHSWGQSQVTKLQVTSLVFADSAQGQLCIEVMNYDLFLFSEELAHPKSCEKPASHLTRLHSLLRHVIIYRETSQLVRETGDHSNWVLPEMRGGDCSIVSDNLLDFFLIQMIWSSHEMSSRS